MKDHQNYWPSYLEYILDEEPARSGFYKGSKIAGQRAWKAGSW